MPVEEHQHQSFRRRPESSNALSSLDPGLRRDDVVSMQDGAGSIATTESQKLVHFWMLASKRHA
ncbi:hypothetical protein N9H39_10935 [Gammaproteobacteria bacterium]|nr:hypothetical protein [Gammaproteobacteria bacterium]